jgi:hypothetical protein
MKFSRAHLDFVVLLATSLSSLMLGFASLLVIVAPIWIWGRSLNGFDIFVFGMVSLAAFAITWTTYDMAGVLPDEKKWFQPPRFRTLLAIPFYAMVLVCAIPVVICAVIALFTGSSWWMQRIVGLMSMPCAWCARWPYSLAELIEGKVVFSEEL